MHDVADGLPVELRDMVSVGDVDGVVESVPVTEPDTLVMSEAVPFAGADAVGNSDAVELTVVENDPETDGETECVRESEFVTEPERECESDTVEHGDATTDALPPATVALDENVTNAFTVAV